MPRDGSGLYHRPPGTDGVPDTSIDSAKYNAFTADVETDLNTPRPIVAGGTGANNAIDALTNLGGERGAQPITNYGSAVFQSGSFYSAAGAVGAPVTGHAFVGTVLMQDANNMILQARDLSDSVDPGRMWVREMTGGTWGTWRMVEDPYVQDTVPANPRPNQLWWDARSALLYIYYDDGTSKQWVIANPPTIPQVTGGGGGSASITISDTPPSSPSAGALWWESDSGLLFIYYTDANSSQWVCVNQSAQVTQTLTVPRGHLSGLTLSTAGASTTFGIAVGQCADSTATDFISIPSAMTKNTASWAPGTGAGSIDTGAIAINTWYHVYAIKNVSTGLTDIIVSTSASGPTMPSGYTLFRRIGSMRTNASNQWILFHQNGDEFLWDVRVLDISGITVGTSAGFPVLTVPTGIQVNALFAARIDMASGAGVMLYTSPDESDQAAGGAVASLVASATGQPNIAANFNIRTDTSGRIRGRANVSSGMTHNIDTYGWIDRRGRDL